MYETLLLLHVVGATIWTGGHLILTFGYLIPALRSGDVTALSAFEARFERVGIPALLAQVGTGLYLAWRWIPDASRWLAFDDHLSRHVGAKLVLLALTVALALHARLRLVPNLTAPSPPSRREVAVLASHVIAVTVASVLFVLVGVDVRLGALL